MTVCKKPLSVRVLVLCAQPMILVAEAKAPPEHIMLYEELT